MSSMSMRPGWIFQFGEFQLDVSARSLRREKAIVPLSSRAFDVLLYFVQNPGKVLTRDEMLKNVWAGSFVDENSLALRLVAVLAVAAISVAGFYAWKQFHGVPQQTHPPVKSSTPTVARRSIAVLGIRNLSGRPEEG